MVALTISKSTISPDQDCIERAGKTSNLTDKLQNVT